MSVAPLLLTLPPSAARCSSSVQTAMQVAVLNAKCVERAQENGERSSKKAAMKNNAIDTQGNTPVAKFCCGDNAQQVRVRQMEGLDELSWGELEGKDYSEEPWKGRLAELKAAWDAGHYDRYRMMVHRIMPWDKVPN